MMRITTEVVNEYTTGYYYYYLSLSNYIFVITNFLKVVSLK